MSAESPQPLNALPPAAAPSAGRIAAGPRPGPTVAACAGLLETLADTMAEGFLLHDADGRIAGCNRAAQRILCRTESELIGKALGEFDWNVVYEDGSPFPASAWPPMCALATGEAQIGVVMGIGRPAGGRTWLQVSSQPLFSAAGRVEGALTIFSDITNLKLQEQQAIESEARWWLALDAAGLGVWDWSADSGRVRFSPRAAALLGLPASPIGHPLADWEHLIHPEDRPQVQDRLSRYLREPGGTFQLGFRIAPGGAGTGRELLARGGVVEASPQGKPLRITGTLADLTESQRTARALRDSERMLAQLSRAIEQMALAVVITDADGRIEYVNPACCRIYGYALDELLGENPRIFKSGHNPPECYTEMWATLTSGRTWRGILCNRRRDGSLLWESVTISPVADLAAGTTHYVAVKEDISERLEAAARERALEARMHRLERTQALGMLVGGVAHDFNNILVAINGFAEFGETLLRSGQPPARIAGYFAEIRTAGERARLLVRHLLAAGRAAPTSLAEVALPELIGETVSLVSVSLPRHTRIETDCQEALPTLRADASQLHQVLLNLLLNARDAMTAGGVITVRAELTQLEGTLRCEACGDDFAGEYLHLAVSDQGPGIAPEVRARLFEPFYTTKDVGKGTGLGLAVVDGIVHRHGGHLTVDSPPAGGAAFHLYLPRVAPEADGEPAPV